VWVCVGVGVWVGACVGGCVCVWVGGCVCGWVWWVGVCGCVWVGGCVCGWVGVCVIVHVCTYHKTIHMWSLLMSNEETEGVNMTE